MCHWWNRWYHERLRNADVLWLLPALQLRAMERTADPHEQQRLVDEAFRLHAALPGQEHWHCDCAPPWAVGEDQL